MDLRRKLPYAVGILYRLLRQGRRVYVTCTTGLDRSPACVIAYLHWIQDVALQEAVDYIKRLHPCGPDMYSTSLCHRAEDLLIFVATLRVENRI